MLLNEAELGGVPLDIDPLEISDLVMGGAQGRSNLLDCQLLAVEVVPNATIVGVACPQRHDIACNNR